MRKILMAMMILLASASLAYAGQGGEGNNQGCNGQGNPNSPCIVGGNGGNGGNGGQGGQGGNGGASISVSASQATAKGKATASSNGVYTGGNNATTVNVDGNRYERYAPGAGAPALTSAGMGVCLGSVSVGLSGPMAGASFGVTKVDKGCERRNGAALLYQMGHPDAAIRLLSLDPEIAEALNPKSTKRAQERDMRRVEEAHTDGTSFNYITVEPQH